MTWLCFFVETVVYKDEDRDNESAGGEGTNVGRLKSFSTDKPWMLACIIRREQLGQQCSTCSSSAICSFGAVQVSA